MPSPLLLSTSSLSTLEQIDNDSHPNDLENENWTRMNAKEGVSDLRHDLMSDEIHPSSKVNKTNNENKATTNTEPFMASSTTTAAAIATAATNCCQVRVGVRVRPLTYNERGVGGQSVVSTTTTDHPTTITLSKSHKFTFDMVFDSNVAQSHLYQSVSPPLLNSFLDGYNATIIAYGQTGSGKTFTMGSEAHTDVALTDNTGLIPRFMNEIFQRLENMKMGSTVSDNAMDDKENISMTSSLFEYELQASFLEVYGEDVHDLLDHSSSPRISLPLREDENGSIVCSGLTSKHINNVSQALQVLHEGTMNRTTAATLMNLTSSRSHAVFSVILTTHHHHSTVSPKASKITTVSRFTFVDLAGSERMKKTGAEGERAREGIKINEGLLALGNVINALADDDRWKQDSKKNIHVPYRQSKLTRLLQDALGGNSQTLFLACVSPSDTNANETLSTLRYANRARNIKNAPTRNVDQAALELQRLQSWSAVLQAELIIHKFGSNSTEENNDNEIALGQQPDDELMKREEVIEYMTKLQSLAQSHSGMTSASSSASVNHPFGPTTSQSNHDHLASILTSPRRNLASKKEVRATPMKMQTNSPANNLNNKSILEDFDSAFLGETNPDEEMAILDQLLDIQHHDQMFDTEKKRGSAILKQVDGELAEQEVMLLQLRKSLEVYHTMKIKYENLMTEVQQLESEKTQLAEKLRQATVDPSQGCSLAIRKELEKVEQSLVRARNETRKHREMYRKAEQEAQKCRTLERKITELKASRVQLMKKQKETIQRHREYTETKTREVLSLKRKEKKNEFALSKLQRDIDHHKRHVYQKHEYNQKLSEKLKQTEQHVMKLLSMRQRDLRSDAFKPKPTTTKNTNHHKNQSKIPVRKNDDGDEIMASGVNDDNDGSDHTSKSNHDKHIDFASEESEEYVAKKSMLDRIIQDNVNYNEIINQCEECYKRYSDAMRTMVSSVRALNEFKQDPTKCDENDNDYLNNIRELEECVEDSELKVELIGSELENYQKELVSASATHGEDGHTHGLNHSDKVDEDGRSLLYLSSGSAPTILKECTTPILRSLLLHQAIPSLIQEQSHRKQLEETLKRKEAVIQSFESEVEESSHNIEALKNEIIRHQQHYMDANTEEVKTGIATVDGLQNELMLLQTSRTELEQKHCDTLITLEKTKREYNQLAFEYSEARERCAMAEVALRQQQDRGAFDVPEDILCQMQTIWREMGIPSHDKDRFYSDIENCLHDTCSRKLLEVASQKAKMVMNMSNLQSEIDWMKKCLEIPSILTLDVNDSSNLNGHESMGSDNLINKQNILQEEAIILRKRISTALDQRNELLKQVKSIKLSMGLEEHMLHEDLHILLNEESLMQQHPFLVTHHDDKTVIGINDSDSKTLLDSKYDNIIHLSTSFFTRCETILKGIRIQKSQSLSQNDEYQKICHSLVLEMKISRDQATSLIVQAVKQRDQYKKLPSWWSHDMSNVILADIFQSQKGLIRVEHSYTIHLFEVYKALMSIGRARRLLSEKLRIIIERSQQTLLQTVDGEVDATEAYTSFHETLFRLPALSKERIHSCITEIKMLNDGVDAMSQSEIEALTVVWEALFISMSERGKFWNEIESAVSPIQMQPNGPFDDIILLFQHGSGHGDNINDDTCYFPEEWVLAAIKDVTKSYRQLESRLYKLELIHLEVERLRTRQDVKSRILSLDTEICIINAKLNDFEDKKCDKQRLTTKKDTSSSLLKEERFRKHMQTKFSSKLVQLKDFLQLWKSSNHENETSSTFGFENIHDCNNESLLSDEVREILNTSPRHDFMHLRTVKYNGPSSTTKKRKVGFGHQQQHRPPAVAEETVKFQPSHHLLQQKQTPIKQKTKIPLAPNSSAKKGLNAATKTFRYDHSTSQKALKENTDTTTSMLRSSPSRLVLRDVTSTRATKETKRKLDEKEEDNGRRPIKSRRVNSSYISKSDDNNIKQKVASVSTCLQKTATSSLPQYNSLTNSVAMNKKNTAAVAGTLNPFGTLLNDELYDPSHPFGSQQDSKIGLTDKENHL